MLTFALCVIAFFVGFVLAIAFMIYGFSSLFKSGPVTAKTNKPQTVYPPQLDNQITISIWDILKCVAEYGYEKYDEIKAFFDNKYDQIIEEKIATLKKERLYVQTYHIWIFENRHWLNKMSQVSPNSPVNPKDDSEKSAGTPQEPLKNPAGTPEELRKEPLDNQGVPVNQELIEDSQKSTSDIWKSTL